MGMHLTGLEWLALLESLESISQVLYYTVSYQNINLVILHQHDNSQDFKNAP